MHFIPTERLLISDLLSSPEPLSAGGWSQHLLRKGWEAEDGPCCLHCEDEVGVCSHHDKTRQEGEAETKPTDAAAKSCGHPVNQPGDTKQMLLPQSLKRPGDMKQTLLYKSLNRSPVVHPSYWASGHGYSQSQQYKSNNGWRYWTPHSLVRRWCYFALLWFKTNLTCLT